MVGTDNAEQRIRRLAVARGTSVAGGAAAYICILFVVHQRTGSSLWVAGALLSTAGVQSLTLPLAGIVADRFDRYSVMVGSDLAACVLFLLLVQDRAPGTILVLAALAAVVEAPFLPASGAAMVDISGTGSELTRANGTMGIASSLGRTLGPVVAGAAIAVLGPGPVFFFNAVSFAVSGLLILSIKPVGHRVTGAVFGFRRHVGTAFARIRDNYRLRLLLLSSAGAYISTSFAMVAEPFLAAEFAVGAVGYGAMVTGWGIGLIAGSWWAGRFASSRGERRVLFRARLIMGGGLLAIAFCPAFWPVPVFMMIGGAGSGSVLVIAYAETQRNAGEDLRSSVLAAMEAVGTASFVLGILAAGALIGALGVTTAYLIAGIGTLATAVPLYLNASR